MVENPLQKPHTVFEKGGIKTPEYVFTRDGFGTMVHRDSYELIRRARIEDVGGIINLIQPLESQGILVKRSRERLEQEIQHFTVMEPRGCCLEVPLADDRGLVTGPAQQLRGGHLGTIE